MLEQIAMQKKRELEKKNVKKEHGELLMDIRAALQNMVAMLVCVKRGNKVPTKKPTEELDKKIDIPMMEKMETDSKIKRGGGGRGGGSITFNYKFFEMFAHFSCYFFPRFSIVV